MTDKRDENSREESGNEAEQMQQAYIERQERWERTGITSAGGAGQTGTPGGQEVGAAIPDEGDEVAPDPVPDDQHTPGR